MTKTLLSTKQYEVIVLSRNFSSHMLRFGAQFGEDCDMTCSHDIDGSDFIGELEARGVTEVSAYCCEESDGMGECFDRVAFIGGGSPNVKLILVTLFNINSTKFPERFGDIARRIKKLEKYDNITVLSLATTRRGVYNIPCDMNLRNINKIAESDTKSIYDKCVFKCMELLNQPSL
jgi:hypothetical protein